MASFLTKTGMGVFKKDGVIVSKFVLTPGKTYMLSDGHTAEDVEDQAALDLIEVTPAPLTDDQEKKRLIKAKMEELAISELKKDGKLDNDGNLIKQL